MKQTDIESFLRENKPQVKDSPTFLLEVQPKMRAVDGIKSEVERQRQYGRQAMIIALVAGLVIGCIVAVLAYLYPINPDSLGENLLTDIKIALESWRHYVLLFVAGCAIALGVICSKRKEGTIGL